MPEPRLLIAVGLMALVGLGCAAGALSLRDGPPLGWTDVVATDTVLRRVSVGLGVTVVLLVVCCAGVALNVRGARTASTATLVWFVFGGLWGNHAVFGDLRPLHTLTNTAIAVLAIALLWWA